MAEIPTGKPLRLRCPNCKASYPNDPIDRDSHSRYCPLVLKNRIKKLEDALEKLQREASAFDLDSVADDVVEDEQPVEVDLDSEDAPESIIPPASDSDHGDGWDDEPEPASVGYLPGGIPIR